jgi:protein-S-isoprenylcysteine O-methyltransferase Ste14
MTAAHLDTETCLAGGVHAGERGARIFEHRKLIHPPLLIAALLLGGATLPGRVIGGVLLLAGLGVRFWACRYMGGAAHVHTRKARKHRPLMTGGPFAHVRHPIYLANGAMLAGACLLVGPAWFAAVAFEAVLLWYRSVADWEERLQASLHPLAWPRYAEVVNGWLPRLVPLRRAELGVVARADTAADEPTYAWRQVLRRERGAIVTVIVLGLLPVVRGLLG